MENTLHPTILLVLTILTCGFLLVIIALLTHSLFQGLNALQYVLQRPYRLLLKQKSPTLRLYYILLSPVRWVLLSLLYLLTLPLRIVNAFYYDLLVLTIWNGRDIIAELIFPKRKGMRHLHGFAKYSSWIVHFPERLLEAGWQLLFIFLNGIAMFVSDIFFPTITMHHGTSSEAAVSITQRGLWLVGSGDYAGRGLYFAFDPKVAKHYARNQTDGVIIVSRVTLGRNYPLSCAPKHINRAIGQDGAKISRWGRRWGIRSIEHWRDAGWWEYCILYPKDDSMIRSWRIRPLYVIGKRQPFPKRIWGGTYIWLQDGKALLVFIISVSILLALLWIAYHPHQLLSYLEQIEQFFFTQVVKAFAHFSK